MNYLINSNIDFYKEINCFDNQDNDEYKKNEENICLLTGEILSNNYIKLDCNHKFNYLPLYYEIIQQKKSKSYMLESTKLLLNQIKCPYCRNITNHLLPYIIDNNVEQKNGVNSPFKYCLQINNCNWIYKNGKNKGNKCNCSSFIFNDKNLCLKHHKINIKNNTKLNKNEYDIEIINKISKNYNIIQLKNLLKQHNLKISGNKNDLITRVLDNKINIFE